jgi:3-methyladenine DNA glycosylase AlkD
MIDEIRKTLTDLKDDSYAVSLQRFFKTGPGEYGEGDVFIGLRVPQLRVLASRFEELETDDAVKLLRSRIHEERLLALLILVGAYKLGSDPVKKKIFDLYLENTYFINNWDLVDSSAEHIVGAHIFGKSTRVLRKLARSASLWERRIAIMSTFHFIKKGCFDETVSIIKLLLKDREDLIHKAAGWMLREIGKRNIKAEKAFLKEHYHIMPRTMLRYAIERFPEEERRKYLEGTVDQD